MHAPLFTYDDNGEQVYGFVEGKAELLVDLLKEFDSVKVFSGHSHRTMSFVHPQYPNIVEYNVTSVGGELWNTPNICSLNIGEDGGDAGFYLADDESTVAAGKAYLRVPGGNGVTAKMLHISFGDDADAIVSPLAETDDDAMYNLAGQRIQKIQKGIYIKGGKKILR